MNGLIAFFRRGDALVANLSGRVSTSNPRRGEDRHLRKPVETHVGEFDLHVRQTGGAQVGFRLAGEIFGLKLDMPALGIMLTAEILSDARAIALGYGDSP